jgi:hypothetical protein
MSRRQRELRLVELIERRLHRGAIIRAPVADGTEIFCVPTVVLTGHCSPLSLE